MENAKSKKMHLEILRIICIFFVIFNHTAPGGYLGFVGESNGFLYSLYLGFSVLCKIAVPVFFMISGALLLGRSEPLRVLLTKRVLRMVIVLLAFSVLHYLVLPPTPSRSIGGFFRTFYTSTATTSLWYLYVYIGFLLMLPFLRAMAVRLKEKDYVYLLVLHLLFTVTLTAVDAFVFTEGHNEYITLAIALESNIFYPLMGYYVENVMPKSRFNRKNYLLAGGAGIAAIILTCVVSVLYYGTRSSRMESADYETCFGILLCVPVIALYYIFKGPFKMKHDGFMRRFVTQLGAAVFGVYLIEKFVRLLLGPVWRAMIPMTGGFVAAIAIVLMTMVIGFAIICLLKNIPFVKKIVNQFI